MIHELKTYRFTFDPSRNRWQIETPRQYRKLGTSRTGLRTYEICNIPEYMTREQLAAKMPHPPEHEFYLSYDNAHLWREL